MSAIGVHLGRPTTAALDDALASVAADTVTYDHVGSTLRPGDWPTRTAYERTVELGRGDACFDAARDSLRDWACHRGVRARVHPAGAPLAEGTDVVIVLPAGPLVIVVPNRIVGVVDETDLFGFAYGTLPGHQERGEEAFLARRHPDGRVTATVRVDARTATFAARALGPTVLGFQRLALQRYLAAWRADALL